MLAKRVRDTMEVLESSALKATESKEQLPRMPTGSESEGDPFRIPLRSGAFAGLQVEEYDFPGQGLLQSNWFHDALPWKSSRKHPLAGSAVNNLAQA